MNDMKSHPQELSHSVEETVGLPMTRLGGLDLPSHRHLLPIGPRGPRGRARGEGYFSDSDSERRPVPVTPTLLTAGRGRRSQGRRGRMDGRLALVGGGRRDALWLLGVNVDAGGEVNVGGLVGVGVMVVVVMVRARPVLAKKGRIG